jgi:hypothetical protein
VGKTLLQIKNHVHVLLTNCVYMLYRFFDSIIVLVTLIYFTVCHNTYIVSDTYTMNKNDIHVTGYVCKTNTLPDAHFN